MTDGLGLFLNSGMALGSSKMFEFFDEEVKEDVDEDEEEGEDGSIESM